MELMRDGYHNEIFVDTNIISLVSLFEVQITIRCPSVSESYPVMHLFQTDIVQNHLVLHSLPRLRCLPLDLHRHGV